MLSAACHCSAAQGPAWLQVSLYFCSQPSKSMMSSRHQALLRRPGQITGDKLCSGHWTSLCAHTLRNNFWFSAAHLQNRCILSQTALEVNDVFETPAVVETASSHHQQTLKTRHAKKLSQSKFEQNKPKGLSHSKSNYWPTD